MAEPLVFISYKHEHPYAEMASKLHLKLKNAAPTLKYEVFIDREMVAGQIWRPELAAKLELVTHFIAFLCDEYWASEECQNELLSVVNRYEAAGQDSPASKPRAPVPRLLFVQAGPIDPRYLSFDEARQTKVLTSPNARIGTIADVNFLGPFDLEYAGKLETMEREPSAKRDNQLAQLFTRFVKTLG